MPSLHGIADEFRRTLRNFQRWSAGISVLLLFVCPAAQPISAVEHPPRPVSAAGMPAGHENRVSFPKTAVRKQRLAHSSSPYAPAVRFDPGVPMEEEPFVCRTTENFLEALGKPASPLAKDFEQLLGVQHDELRTALDEHAIGIQPVPERPPLLVEANDKFLGIGALNQGVRIKTGAVWRPSLWVFGTYRTGINYFDRGSRRHIAEWANRLDLFTQLNLSGTERIVYGIRPFDEEKTATRSFGGIDFDRGRHRDGWNGDVQTLFFEGDFGELFPSLDPFDRKALDVGFSIGRQPMSFQQGLLINEDCIDALTVTRNTLSGNGNLNLRTTAVYAWNAINRHSPSNGNINDDDAQMVGLFTESDFRESTVNADAAFVWSDNGTDDLVAVALSGIRRISGFHNTYNSSLHVLASFPTNAESVFARQGELLFSQFSWTLHQTHDLVYLNGFWLIDQFTSAARGTLANGPLGQTGLLFSAAGLGRYGAPLGNRAGNVAGGSLGYQMFFDHTKQQIVLEIGGHQDTDGTNRSVVASGVRYQKALDQHWLAVIDGFVSKREGNDVAQGGRIELQMKF